MKKEYKILINYGLYFLTFILIIIIGISGVFADTIMDTGSFINITGRQWTLSGQEFSSGPSYNSNWLLNAYNVTGGIYTPPTSYDYIEYSMFQHSGSAYNPCSGGGFNATFELLFTTPSFVDYVSSVSWANKTCSISSKSTSTGKVGVTCSVPASQSTSTISTIKVNYNQFTTTSNSSIYISRSIPISCVLSQEQLQSSLNQQTGSINTSIQNSQSTITNSIQNSETNIIQNQEDMRDSINQNQNENTNKQIDSQKVCTDYDKSSIVIDGKFLDSTGTETGASNYGITDYIPITKDSVIKVTSTQSSSGANYCFYNVNKEVISCNSLSTLILNEQLTIPSNSSYFRSSIFKNTGKPTYNICINGNQALNDTNKGILGKLGDLISYINPLSENFFVYKLIDLLLDLLKSLFIPDDFDFIYDFMDVLSNKLGFIASVPVKVIEFILDLPDVVFSEVNSLHFPKINIFGYYFWDDMEIDLSVGKSVFASIKYITDIVCVILCVNTLYKWYHTFTGGDAN